jgi:hypothetical protein
MTAAASPQKHQFDAASKDHDLPLDAARIIQRLGHDDGTSSRSTGPRADVVEQLIAGRDIAAKHGVGERVLVLEVVEEAALVSPASAITPSTVRTRVRAATN